VKINAERGKLDYTRFDFEELTNEKRRTLITSNGTDEDAEEE
jgi:hypothetical protein